MTCNLMHVEPLQGSIFLHKFSILMDCRESEYKIHTIYSNQNVYVHIWHVI